MQHERESFPRRPRTGSLTGLTGVQGCALTFTRWLSLWLLAVVAPAAPLDWQSGPGFRRAAVSPGLTDRTGFLSLDPATTGVLFTNHLSEFNAAQNRVFESGSGVALADVDGDGWCDIYFCRLEGRNALYRNLGNWKFEDITERAGVGCPDQYSTGAVLADIEGDGDFDLLVNSIGGGTRCFLNDGKARFNEVLNSRLVRRFASMSMALADVDGDTDLDLYVVNYSTTSYRDNPPGLKVEARMENGKVVVTPPDRFIPIAPRGGAVEVIEMGERDFFYINDGRGSYLPVSWTNGTFLKADGARYTAPPRGWGLAVIFRDLNRDRLPDLYVCNDFFYFADDIWFNVNGHQFREVPASTIAHVSLSSMAIDVADINRDGFDDFFVADMVSRKHAWRHRQRPDLMGGRLKLPIADPAFRQEAPHNTLFLNRGDDTWSEIAQLSRVHATEWTWNAAFLDVDLDGWEDLLIANGNDHDVQDADILHALSLVREEITPESRLRNLSKFPKLKTPNLAFQNDRALGFPDKSREWGFDLDGITHGLALGDLDNDGDLDVVLNNLHSAASLLRNESSQPRVAVRLKGAGMNRHGIGARITLEGGPVTQSQEVMLGGRYLSSDEPLRAFAAAATGGSSTSAMTLRIQWRSGKDSVLSDVKPNFIYEISEPETSAPPRSEPAGAEPLFRFADVSRSVGYLHVDQEYNDFTRQPLLSHSLSQRGPGLMWSDLDGDGWEDLSLGSGRGGVMGVFKNMAGRAFTNITSGKAPFTLWDQMSLVSAPGTNEQPVILASVMSYDENTAAAQVVQILDATGRPVGSAGPAWDAAAGPLALADVDADGDLDLFVGGRVIPGRHPEPASSRLYRRTGSEWQEDAQATELFKKVGMVSGAVFTDLDGDGFPELALACEWGPIRVFGGFHATPAERTASLGLDRTHGWWNGIETGDFDSDGKMDLVASNWGRNHRLAVHVPPGIEARYGDWMGAGTVGALEAYVGDDPEGLVPWRDWQLVSREMPWVRERFPSYRAFGLGLLKDILGERASQAGRVEAQVLDSLLFLNQGQLRPVPLPIEAQFSPAFGICAADFDADGWVDLFFSQNFFGVTLETSRSDAGRGLFLRGEGDGRFKGGLNPTPILGEQRGAAVCDFDKDGRMDIAVAQNSGPAVLLQNRNPGKALRVKLTGPRGNPTGIGARVRG
ncbi:MAG: hypothetical protein FJ405_03175, partial [Verrucomicrobia bacterium]|nr:hypothetical protein [Verrucomicrobiota bacterium]